MSIWIRIGRWFARIQYERTVARLQASVRSQRIHLSLLDEIETEKLSLVDLEEWKADRERVIMIITHLEGLIKEIKIGDIFFMPI